MIKIPVRKKRVSEFVRTLIASGYNIVGSHRQPHHIEISCEYKDIFGSTINYLFAVCQSSPPKNHDLEALKIIAIKKNQNLVIICNNPISSSITFDEFFNALGGTVPSWRALSKDYSNVVMDAAQNKVPSGFKGEAWFAFEELVADGFEFLFGKRSVRLGGFKRGKKVADIFIQLPDNSSVIIDTKASVESFNAIWKNLRALAEYTQTQLKRQKGYFPMTATILVAHSFKQKASRLMNIANDFLASTSIPIVFIPVEALTDMISILSEDVVLRNKINWKNVFGRIGLYTNSVFFDEIDILKQLVK